MTNDNQPSAPSMSIEEAREIMKNWEEKLSSYSCDEGIDIVRTEDVKKIISAVFLVAASEQREEAKKKFLKTISKAYYIDKKFSLKNPEDLKDLEGDIVLVFPYDEKEIITLWCESQVLEAQQNISSNQK